MAGNKKGGAPSKKKRGGGGGLFGAGQRAEEKTGEKRKLGPIIAGGKKGEGRGWREKKDYLAALDVARRLLQSCQKESNKFLRIRRSKRKEERHSKYWESAKKKKCLYLP